MRAQAIAMLLGAGLVAGPVLSQDMQKKNKAGAKVGLAAKNAAAPPAPVAPPPFVPVFWASGVPANAYAHNDPQQFYAWVREKTKSIPGKIDEFSSKEEREQHQARLAEVMQAIGPIAFMTQCSVKYDGEKQAFRILKSVEPIDDFMLKEPNPRDLKLRKFTLSRRDIEKSEYAAQNGYGATSTVTKRRNEEFVLAYPSGAAHEPATLIEDDDSIVKRYRPYSHSSELYEGSAPMSSNDAREKHQDVTCLAVFSLQAPYLFTYTESHAPTHDVPVDRITSGFALYGKLDRFQIVNRKSGEVYAEHTRSGI